MRRVALDIVLLILSVTMAWSEDIVDKCKSMADQSIKKSEIRKVLHDPTGSSPIAAPELKLILEDSKDVEKVKAVASLYRKNLSYDFSLEGPLKKEQQQATFADLNGLANATTGTFAIRFFQWNVHYDVNAMENVFEWCKIVYGCREGIPSDKLDEAWEKGNFIMASDLPEYCQSKFDEEMDWGNPFVLSFTVTAGNQPFQFLDNTSFQPKKESRKPLAQTISAGMFIASRNIFVGGTYRHEKAFKVAGDPQNICIPFDQLSGSLSCNNLPVGEPKKEDSHQGQVEARVFWNNVGVNPKITYNFSEDILGLELPMYIFDRSKNRGLSGGVSVGWRSDKDEIGIRFFVGAALEPL